jgi:hypothetical protein
MAHLQDLLGLSTEEAVSLSDQELKFLAQRVELELSTHD